MATTENIRNAEAETEEVVAEDHHAAGVDKKKKQRKSTESTIGTQENHGSSEPVR